MLDALRGPLLRLLRVPPEPAPPIGEHGSLRVFRAGRNFYRYRLGFWIVNQFFAVMGLIGGLVFLSFIEARVPIDWVVYLARIGEIIAFIGFGIQLLFGLAALRLDFEMRWYMLTDRSMRIREGIFRIQEKTITFANVQEISLHQNPLQRLLRIADVRVRTAGGGGSTMPHDGKGAAEETHAGWFRGVDRASEIRDLIRARVRQQRDAGLGDPDEALHQAAPAAAHRDDGTLAAARELLAEARALRAAAGG